MLQKCCAAIFGFVIASEGEATQLTERKKSTLVPQRSCFHHQLDCFAFARKDGWGSAQMEQRCDHLFNCSNCAIPNFAMP